MLETWFNSANEYFTVSVECSKIIVDGRAMAHAIILTCSIAAYHFDRYQLKVNAPLLLAAPRLHRPISYNSN